jgi:NADH-quinone oxidoreductase subunit D
MGPQHPSTHGVLRLVLEPDGETVLSAAPTIGFLHTGIEKTCEQKKWQQVIPLVERMDYLGAQSNSLAFCLSVERMLGLDEQMPKRVDAIRVLIAELQRISSHLVWFGTHAMEVGAITGLLYALREREQIMNLNELMAGFRFFPSFIRVGGLREDIPRGFKEACKAFLDRFPKKLDEYETLITKNPIWMDRTRGVGVISYEDCCKWGLFGPIARAAGGDYDVRRAFPYIGYDTYEFDVIGASNGDVYDRPHAAGCGSVRSAQALERIDAVGPWAVNDRASCRRPRIRSTRRWKLIQHFLISHAGLHCAVGGPMSQWRATRRAPGRISSRTAPTGRSARPHALAGPGLGAAPLHRQ